MKGMVPWWNIITYVGIKQLNMVGTVGVVVSMLALHQRDTGSSQAWSQTKFRIVMVSHCSSDYEQNGGPELISHEERDGL